MEQLEQIIATLKEYDRDRGLTKGTHYLYGLAYERARKELQPLLKKEGKLLRVVRNRLCLLIKENRTSIIIYTVYSRMLSLLETGTIRELYAKPPASKTMLSYKQFTPTVIRYAKHLESEGKAFNTIESYTNVVKQFLNHLGEHGVGASASIQEELVVSFFEKLRNTWSATSIRVATSGFRHFLAFLGCDEHIHQAIPERCPRHTPIIPMLEREEESAIVTYLEKMDGSHRNKAILAMCYYLGLRAVDIANLRLEQINWINEKIEVSQAKTGRILVLPLLPVVGNHLQRYLLEERPESKSREVFLRFYAPYRSLSSHSAVYKLLRTIFSELGIRRGMRQGSHLLRHHAASKQLLNHIPLGTIAALLGHKRMESTTIYATVDYANLRGCCLSPYLKGAAI